MRPVKSWCERIIETNKTYRVWESGVEHLVQVKNVGDKTIKVIDLRSNQIRDMNRAKFQDALNNGKITVSAGTRRLSETVRAYGIPVKANCVRITDLEAVVEIIAAEASEAPATRLTMRRQGKRITVEAYEGNVLVGYAHLVEGPDFIEADDTDSHDALWIKPDHRRQGLANQLYDFVERKTGRPIIPSEHRSGAGDMFWQKRIKRLPTDHPAHEWI